MADQPLSAALRDLFPQVLRGGLEHDFNSLDAQCEAREAFFRRQAG